MIVVVVNNFGMTKSYVITISFVDGDPNGLRFVERTGSAGVAVVFPRTLFESAINTFTDELKQAGVYLLVGPDKEGIGYSIYIGEAENVANRLKSHVREKDFWTWAFVYVAPGKLNKAHARYIESKLIDRAMRFKSAEVLNSNTSAAYRNLPISDEIKAKTFLESILELLPPLGVNAFVEPAENNHSEILYCKGPGATATGSYLSQGFLVFKGSLARKDTAPSFREQVRGYFMKRQKLIDEGVLVPAENNEDSYIFTQDYLFDSPSAAAAIVLGRSANGRSEWKDAEGRSLAEKEIKLH